MFVQWTMLDNYIATNYIFLVFLGSALPSQDNFVVWAGSRGTWFSYLLKGSSKRSFCAESFLVVSLVYALLYQLQKRTKL